MPPASPAVTRIASPRGPARQGTARADALAREAKDALDEALWRAEGAITYAHYAHLTGVAEEAWRRAQRELAAVRSATSWVVRRFGEAAVSRAHTPRDGDTARRLDVHLETLEVMRLLSRSRRTRLALVAGGLLSCVVLAGVAAAEPCPAARTLAGVAEQERRGELRQAAKLLATEAARCPDDYDVALRLAWSWYRAKDFVAAEAAYRRASALSDGAPDARLGLGWSLLEQRRLEAATAELRAAADSDATRARAQEGLALAQAARPATTVRPSVSMTMRDDAIRGSGFGLALELPAILRDRWLLSGTYRYWNLQGISGGGFSQHEGHFALGYVARSLGVAFHYSALRDGSGVVGLGHVLGASTRLSAFGDLLFETSISLYDSMNVVRTGLAYSLPLGSRVRLVPALSAQRGAGETFGNASLSLFVDASRAQLFFGGKYGDELRPAYLASATVANIPERIAGGFFAGATLPITRRLSLRAAYDFSYLHTTTSSPAAHGFTLGLSFSP